MSQQPETSSQDQSQQMQPQSQSQAQSQAQAEQVAPEMAGNVGHQTQQQQQQPHRQSARIQQQSHNNNNLHSNSNNNNTNNHSSSNSNNQPKIVNMDQIIQATHQATDNMGAMNDLAMELEKMVSAFSNNKNNNQNSPLGSALSDGSDPLNQLIPGPHTLTLLYILSERISRVGKERGEIEYLLSFIHNFANAADAYQLSLAPVRLNYLTGCLSNLVPSNPQFVFEPLYRLITTYTQSMPETLTSLHPILAYHILQTRNYQFALGFIDKTFTDCDRNASPINHNGVLEYYYAAGLLNIKLGRLEEAEDSLEMCVTFPAQAATAIQIEAYKKLVLVQLLRTGKTSELPKYVSSHVTRAIKNKAQLYTNFAQAYQHPAKTTKTIQDQAEKDQNDFNNDQNVGLVIQCLGLHIQRRIQRLARIYSCLSLNDLLNLLNEEVSFNDLAEILNQMNQKGWIICRIDHASPSASPTVSFLNDEENFNDVKSIEKIAHLIREGNEYNAIAAQRERKISRSTSFLTKQSQPGRGDRLGGFGPGDDDSFEDELLA